MRGRPGLTIEQLQALIAKGAYARELQEITISELLRPHAIRSTALEVKSGESLEAAILRVFHQLPERQLASGFFCRYMGLERWTAQKVLAEMADRGLLVRSGKTSGTRYVLAYDRAAGHA
ncbi:hypothetical protein DB30_05971 [Enhygromyxa salina]|uniref:Uncharacterized protein n=1 Tax=Enhygromyxa salina TaxID=215803 RepID=A0A0C2DHA6_9BACT|nr:hypothetical protein [Enhygromyxa salina]KIG19067.1 hypothetical protein DB30_05971 [Enhygromyxa salina]